MCQTLTSTNFCQNENIFPFFQSLISLLILCTLSLGHTPRLSHLRRSPSANNLRKRERTQLVRKFRIIPPTRTLIPRCLDLLVAVTLSSSQAERPRSTIFFGPLWNFRYVHESNTTPSAKSSRKRTTLLEIVWHFLCRFPLRHSKFESHF